MLIDVEPTEPYSFRMGNGYGVAENTPEDVLQLMREVNDWQKDAGQTPWYYIGVPSGMFERLLTPLKVNHVSGIGLVYAQAPFNPEITQKSWGKSPLPKTEDISFAPSEIIVENGYIVGISTLQKVDCMNKKHIYFDPTALTTVGPMEKKEP